MEDQILKVKQRIEQYPKVKETNYVSSQQVYNDFKAKNADKPEILQSLNELTDNPFPATLHVKAKNLSDYPDIASQLSSDQYKDFVSNVNYQNDPKTQVVISRLDKILKLVIEFGIGLIIVFSLIAILVIFNTIALTIYNRREEVEIMRLVGATNWYIRGPFLIESCLYSVFSTIIAGLLLVPVYVKVLPKVVAFINPEADAFTQNILNFWYLLPVLFVLALVLAAISTFMATRKYLKI
jgi:cell division transport system permease protein